MILDKISQVVENQALNEYDYDYLNKKVRNPKTNRIIKVGSLPPEAQEKYRPKKTKLHKTKEEKPKMDDFDIQNKLVFDFYISIPEEEDNAEDYIERNPSLIATLDSADVLKMFKEGSHVIKMKHVPINALKKYLNHERDSDLPMGDETVTFVDMPDKDAFKKFEFVKFNNYHIFQIEPMEYMEQIDLVNDTPDDKGFKLFSKKDKDGVMENLSLDSFDSYIIEATAKEQIPIRHDDILETISSLEEKLFKLKSGMKSNDGDDVQSKVTDDSAEDTLAEYKLIQRELFGASSTVEDLIFRYNQMVNKLEGEQKIEKKIDKETEVENEPSEEETEEETKEKPKKEIESD